MDRITSIEGLQCNIISDNQSSYWASRYVYIRILMGKMEQGVKYQESGIVSGINCFMSFVGK